ncbi:MAG TPA: hypothetical protein VGO62_17660, partial [Myxococcota bacterium]
WRDPLVRAIRRLDAEGIGARELAALADDSDVGAHAKMLAALCAGVESARASEGVESSARHASRRDVDARGVGAAGCAAAVVAGDRLLARAAHEGLTRFLARLPRRRVILPNLVDEAALPRGLVDAAGPCRLVIADYARARPTSVRALRTPDDVRECVEAVRVVQQAIVDGIALDRIAVIAPDARNTPVLQRAFARARIPATFLIARPLRTLPMAGWLKLVVDIAAGDEGCGAIAGFLLHPCTNLRALGDVVGRARFRTLMGRVRNVRGLARMALRLEQDAAEDDNAPEHTTTTPRPAGGQQALPRDEWRRTARSNLVFILRKLDGALGPLRAQQSLGAHGRALVDVTRRLARKSAARARVVQAVMPWVAEGGPAIGAGELSEEVRVLLDGDAPLEPLVDAAVRVFAPLQALGGSFDLVVVTGAVEGRLPTALREDPVLPDRLLVKLAVHESLTSKADELLERLRFAACTSAAAGSLVIMCPAEELDSGRALVPSLFVQRLLTARARRSSPPVEWSSSSSSPSSPPGELERRGSRARPWLDAAGQPLGADERAAQGARAGGVASLGDDARAVVALEAALRAGAPDVLPATFVAPPSVDARGFVQLAHDPLSFFFGEVLRARRAARIDPGRSPLEPGGVRALVRQSLEESTAQAGALADDVMQRVHHALSEAKKDGISLDDDDIQEAAHAARAAALAFIALEPGYPDAARAADASRAIDAALRTSQAAGAAALLVQDRGGRIVDDPDGKRALVFVADDKPAKFGERLHPAHVALALRDDLARVRISTTTGASSELARDDVAALIKDAVTIAAAAFRSRTFPAYDGEGRFALEAERAHARTRGDESDGDR